MNIRVLNFGNFAILSKTYRHCVRFCGKKNFHEFLQFSAQNEVLSSKTVSFSYFSSYAIKNHYET